MIKRGLSGILIFVLCFEALFVNVRAQELDETLSTMQQQEAETKATISDLEKQTKETRDAITQLQGQQQQTQQNVSALQSQSSSLQSTINGYTSKLTTLDQEISEAESAMAQVSSEIVQLEKELQTAKAQEKDRYDLLKKRLQSTYENGGSKGLLQILLVSGTLEEFLTKFEYLDAIIRYDKRKIAEYQALQDTISAKKAAVEEKEAELDNYQSQLDEKHDELATLTDNVKSQLSSTNSNLNSEKNKLANFDQLLKDLDAKMKSLESQTAAAQAKLAQQIAERLALTREDTSGSYDASDEELVWLAATIQAEAGGESYTGKLAVGSVIMNRVKSSAFPNTIVAVITQNLQFASYRSGKVDLIMSNGPNSTCVNAAREVLAGARVGDYLFFMTKYWADYYCISEYTMIGNHAFFYRWVTTPKPEPAPVSEEAPADQSTEEATFPEETPQPAEPATPEPQPTPDETPAPEPTPAPEETPQDEQTTPEENPQPEEPDPTPEDNPQP
jgi:spore germination cell wall hydrolase CwlJ-like protein